MAVPACILPADEGALDQWFYALDSGYNVGNIETAKLGLDGTVAQAHTAGGLYTIDLELMVANTVSPPNDAPNVRQLSRQAFLKQLYEFYYRFAKANPREFEAAGKTLTGLTPYAPDSYNIRT